MWSNKHGQSQTCWGQAAPSGGQMTPENIFRSHQLRWAFPHFAHRYVTLLFVSDQNRFFCCFFFFFRTSWETAWSLHLASDVINNVAPAYKGRWREREKLRERASGLCQYNTCTVLSSPLQKQLADAVPAQTMDLDVYAQAPVFEIRNRDLWFHLKLLCFRKTCDFPVDPWSNDSIWGPLMLRAPSAVLESIIINAGSSEATTLI